MPSKVCIEAVGALHYIIRPMKGKPLIHCEAVLCEIGKSIQRVRDIDLNPIRACTVKNKAEWGR